LPEEEETTSGFDAVMDSDVVDPRDLAARAGFLPGLGDEALAAKVEDLMMAYPDLSANGLGLGRNSLESHEAARRALAGLDGIRQVQACLMWMGSPEPLKPSARPSRLRTSSAWKAVVEQDARSYVSNGAFVAAAILVGLLMIPDRGTVNVMIRFAVPGRMEAIRVQRLKSKAA